MASTVLGIEVFHLTEANPTIAAMYSIDIPLALILPLVLRSISLLIVTLLSWRAGITLSIILGMIHAEAFITNMSLIFWWIL